MASGESDPFRCDGGAGGFLWGEPVSESESVKLPEIPGELWMLVFDDEPTVWVEAKEAGDETVGLLVYFSKQSAIDGAAKLADLCDISCFPVRVK